MEIHSYETGIILLISIIPAFLALKLGKELYK
jgi:photosystem I reaction center subunit XII